MYLSRVVTNSLLLVLIAQWPSVLRAQDQPTIEPGARIRVRANDPEGWGRKAWLFWPAWFSSKVDHHTGEFIGIDDSSIHLKHDKTGQLLVLDFENIANMELSTRPSKRWRGALIGGGLGVIAGVTAGLVSGSDPPDELGREGYSAGDKAGLLGFGIGVFCAMLGAAVSPGEQWAEVALDDWRTTGPSVADSVPQFAINIRF